MTEPRRCEWCKGPMPAGRRADAKTCSKSCRQAKARFRICRPSIEQADRPMRFAYADPPYPGLARRYYGHEEVDHRELIDRLVAEFPDGWALSTSSKALRDVWALCPPDTRLHVWVNGPRKVSSLQALRAWEAVLVSGGRPRREAVVADLSDVLIYGGRQRLHPGALVGMKPAPFCEWVFELLGATRGDELADLFPGSGAVQRAWRLYTSPPDPGDASRPTTVPRDVSPPPAGPRDVSPVDVGLHGAWRRRRRPLLVMGE